MRFYINILTTYYPDLDPPYDVYYQQILEQIELAEELGWECFMFNEHHFLGYGGLVANPAVLLAAAAARTSRIRLGPCIAILPLRHPLQSAEDYAMVDSVSGGSVLPNCAPSTASVPASVAVSSFRGRQRTASSTARSRSGRAATALTTIRRS